jgi:hypothetical protein
MLKQKETGEKINCNIDLVPFMPSDAKVNLFKKNKKKKKIVFLIL